MNLREARVLGEKLIEEHLNDWILQFNQSKKQMGVCCYNTKTIKLSKFFVELMTKTEVEETLLHEIAHAKAGYVAGHGWKWKQVARNIGLLNPTRTGKILASLEKQNEVLKPKYTATCPNCQKEVPMHRMRKRVSACFECCNNYNQGRFDSRFVFQITKNY